MSTPDAHDTPAGAAWRVTSLWECYEGEARVNLLRIAGIAIFYAIHLINRHLLGVEGLTEELHRALTGVAVGWVLLALGVHLSLLRRLFPAWLRYLSTAGDFVLIGLLLAIADGPQSPMVAVLFLALTASALRFDLRLLHFAAVAAVGAYVVAVGNAHWWRPELQVSRHAQLTIVAALLVQGVVLGQLVRRVRPLAEEYAARLTGELPASQEEEAEEAKEEAGQ